MYAVVVDGIRFVEQKLADGDDREAVGIARLLQDTPLHTVSGEHTDAAQLQLTVISFTHVELHWNKIQVDKTRGKILDALPHFVVCEPHVVSGLPFRILPMSAQRRNGRWDGTRSRAYPRRSFCRA